MNHCQAKLNSVVYLDRFFWCIVQSKYKDNII